jgi:translocation and assembly module TamA
VEPAPAPPAQSTPAPTPAPAPTDQFLDPAAPMADLPDLGVAWPDLNAAPQGQDQASVERAEVPQETRYTYHIDGLGDADSVLLQQRFQAGSALEAHDGDETNAAQLDRRAREDAQLLNDLLRAEGYYAARVATMVEPDGAAVKVTLQAEPGPLYKLSEVKLAGIDEAGEAADKLRKAFGVKAGDPVDADKITDGLTRMRTQIGELGFPFADVTDPVITVDHNLRTAKLVLEMEPGGARKFGTIHMADEKIFDARHVQYIARFHPGQPYSTTAVDDLRHALVQTGLVASATVTPVKGADPDIVDLDVTLTPAPPRTIAAQLGYGTGQGAQVEVDWTHRNLIQPEGALLLRGILGTQEQLASSTLRFNNFRGRDRVLTAQFSASHTVRDAYEAKTLEILGSLEKQTNIFFQKKWTWSLGVDFAASDEKDIDLATNLPRDRLYYIGSIPTGLNYDGSDDLLDPHKGFRLGGRASPEVSLAGKAFTYLRLQFDASAYKSVSPKIVLASRVRLGTIVGAPRDEIAPSRRFYAGGGASIRGYGYQDVGPRDANNDPIGGKSLAEFSIEARVKVMKTIGLVPFLDGGNISTNSFPRVRDFRWGTGIGLRYYSSFGPIRLDLGTPLNPQPGDPRIAVYVSLGQAF